MKNIVIFSLEPLETRYTCEWFTFLPDFFKEHLGNDFRIIQVNGEQKNSKTTDGAFLNFADTNYWKSKQLCNFLELYNNGSITNNDHIIFTDFWNPTVIQLKYMKDLLGLNWNLHGIVHAGSYDPYDLLGYTIKDKTWVSLIEKGFFEAFDYTYFATQFHIDMFCTNLLGKKDNRLIRSGFPFDYLPEIFSKYKSKNKKDIILFPHRKSKEKQLDIFLDLKKSLPKYEFIVCADLNLTKNEYRNLVGESKLLFSANLQETLGITSFEMLAAGGAILVPERLSYKEMYSGEFIYPSEWSSCFNNYLKNKENVLSKINNIMMNFSNKKIQSEISANFNNVSTKFFSGKEIIKVIQNEY